MRRSGGTRRIAAVAAAAVALTCLAVIAACGNPQQSVRHCQGAPEESILAIQEKVTARREASQRKDGAPRRAGPTSSAPRSTSSPTTRTTRATSRTWATDDIKSTDEFQSVDVHAREESTWPHAPFDVTADGAIESRACVGLNTGKTKAQIQCEQRTSSGESVALPVGQGLQRPMSVTTDLSAPEQPDSVPPRRPTSHRLRDVTENRTVRFVSITVAVAAFGYYVPQWAWDWDMPAGELVYGFIIGSLTALMAFGLALIYQSNRVINFAQADLGAVPASLCVVADLARAAGRSGSRSRSR